MTRAKLKHPPMGWLWVACWCGRDVIEFEVGRIGECGVSCGRDGCIPPAGYCPTCGCSTIRWAGCSNAFHDRKKD